MIEKNALGASEGAGQDRKIGSRAIADSLVNTDKLACARAENGPACRKARPARLGPEIGPRPESVIQFTYRCRRVPIMRRRRAGAFRPARSREPARPKFRELRDLEKYETLWLIISFHADL